MNFFFFQAGSKEKRTVGGNSRSFGGAELTVGGGCRKLNQERSTEAAHEGS